MIENIEFQNFRGFSNLKMKDTKQITLISGMNNVGKSSVLDGLFLFFDHITPESFVKLNNFRGFPPLPEPKYLWEPVFHNLNTQEPVQINLNIDGQSARLHYSRDDSYVVPEDSDVPKNVLNQFISSTQTSYTLKFQYTLGKYWETGHFITNPSGMLRNMDTSLDGNRILPLNYTQFINAAIVHNGGDLTTWIGDLELSGRKEELVEALRLIEPSISDITTIMTANGGAQIYIKVSGRLLPLKLAGDGLNKLLFIVLSIMAHPNSLFLIDEIETGIHYSAYIDFWKTISLAARKYNCQIIATTHSYECIVGAIDGIEQTELTNSFCYFRIVRDGEECIAHRYSDDLLRTAIDTNLEVR